MPSHNSRQTTCDLLLLSTFSKETLTVICVSQLPN